MPSKPSSGLTPFCPRCGGRLRRMSDLYGEYDWCLVCGYHGNVLLGPPMELKAQRTRDPSRKGQKL